MATNIEVLAEAPPADREELERQRFDVRHIMRLQVEGSTFVTHFKDEELMKSLSSDERSPAGKLMLKHLHAMQRDAERELQSRLRAMPLNEALDHEGLVHYWGADRRDFETMACDWYAFAKRRRSDAQGFPTPAYYLLTHRPPVPFDFERSRLWELGPKLVNHIVEGRVLDLSKAGLNQLQSKLAA
jgi:hypothetical protein